MQTEIAQKSFHWQSSSNIYLEKISEIDKRLTGNGTGKVCKDSPKNNSNSDYEGENADQDKVLHSPKPKIEEMPLQKSISKMQLVQLNTNLSKGLKPKKK